MQFELTQKKLFFIIIFWCLLSLIFHIHGFSINSMAGHVHASSPATEILGNPNGWRGDDFNVALPLNFSQIYNTASPFSKNNSLIGVSQAMTFSSYATVSKHWSTIFKPQTWGYFLGPNVGMSWHWLFLSVGLFLAFYFFAATIFTITAHDAFLLASAFVLSPFFQFWSYIIAPAVIFMLFSLTALSKLLFENEIKKQVLSSLMICYSATCFALVFYPPVQSMSLFFALMCIIAFIINFKSQITITKINIGVAGLILAIGLLGIYYLEHKDLIQIMQNTSYPGKRFILGGWGFSELLIYFNNQFVFLPKVRNFDTIGGNICEASAFIQFIPICYLVLGFNFKKLNKLSQNLFIISIFFVFTFLYWFIFGFNEQMATLTGFFLVPLLRSVIFVGLLNFLLIILVLKNKEILQQMKASLKTGILFLWISFHLFFLFRMAPVIEDRHFHWEGLALALLFGYVSYNLLFKSSRKFLTSYLVLHILYTFLANPIVIGGYENIYSESELALIMKEANPTISDGKWIVFGNSFVNNIPRANGIPSFGGAHFYPQSEFWKILDPQNVYKSVWNRYAHINFSLNDKFAIVLKNTDTLNIQTSLDSPELLNLPYKFVLIDKNNTQIKSAFELMNIGNNKNLYIIKSETNNYIALMRK